jgi:hypothetical protein
VTQAGLTPTLAVSPPNQEVTYVPGSTAFTVSSNTNWSVSGTATWCTFTTSGSGNGTIVVDYSQNGTDQPRVASLDVTVAGLPVQTVTVTQAKSSIGMGESNGSGFHIYPNPTRGIFKLVPDHPGSGAIEITVQDLNGKSILTKEFKGQSEYVVDLSAAPQGTYNIIVKSESSLLVKKLVVIR